MKFEKIPDFLMNTLEEAIQEFKAKYIYSNKDIRIAIDEWSADDEGYFFIPIYIDEQPLLKLWAYNDSDTGNWDVSPSDHTFSCVSEYTSYYLGVDGSDIEALCLGMATEIEKLRNEIEQLKSK
ncbi:hypothetical protein [Mannheimia indoligenes]|uniref:hypothetical protein n=1 Tax=Mannheimia indoligenes TaxID=3103145 RepID=UPI002FE5809E